MPTLILDPIPPELEQLLEERARLDLDRRDEVWDGVLHVIPPPSHAHERLLMKLAVLLAPYAEKAGLELTGGVAIGTGKQNYRVPDLALHRAGAPEQWHPTAALVVEIVSPGDQSWEKLAFYAVHQVDEVVIVDLDKPRVDWLALEDDEYRAIGQSGLLALSAAELEERLDWR